MANRQPHDPAEVLAYLFAHTERPYPVTWLLKVLYLADLEAREWLGRPITSLSYTFHHHGPFDANIYSALDGLELAGVVESQERSGITATGEYWEGRYYAAAGKRQGGCLLDPAETAVIDSLIHRFSGSTASAIKRLSYDTQPMRVAQSKGRGTSIDMTTEDRRASREHAGLDVDSVLQAESEVARGETFPLAEVERELRDRAERNG